MSDREQLKEANAIDSSIIQFDESYPKRPHTIITSNLTEDQIKMAIILTSKYLDNGAMENGTATTLKQAFQEHYNGAWHALVGRAFGCSLTHKVNQTLYFSIQKSDVEVLYVLVWRSLG
jgi:hypothetical protein